LIDSPGLNEAESRAKITLDYLPDVDAAVFLTSSNAALGMQEVSALQHVTSLHSAVFLVCNHFDAVRAKERPALVNYVFGVLAKHTILPKDRVFFTSALRALEGRLDKDEAQVSASHLPEFEQALHRFLTNERGKAKLLGAAQQLEAHLHVGQGIIPERLALLSRGLEDLEARYLGKQEPLKRLEMARRLILARFVAFLKTVMMDPKKAPDIAEIRVGHPSPFLANGIVIIDTPGFDAPEAGHAEIAKHVVGFIADCAVVLTPSYSPASLKLVDFLNSYLGPYLHRCVYVVTMMDRLRGKDGDAVLSHVRRRLGDSLTLSGVQVQPVAAQIMLDRLCSSDTSASELVWAEQFREFERALDIRVKRERASAIAEKIARLQCEALGRVENHLKLAADRFDQRKERIAAGFIPDVPAFTLQQRLTLQRGMRSISDQALDSVSKEVASHCKSSLANIPDSIFSAPTTDAVTSAYNSGPGMLSPRDEGRVGGNSGRRSDSRSRGYENLRHSVRAYICAP
jgi:hypothetical protein